MSPFGGEDVGNSVPCSTAANMTDSGAEIRVGPVLEGEINVGSSPWENIGVMVEPMFAEGMKVASLGRMSGVTFPLACARALAKARNVTKRCCGSLARAIEMTCST